MADTLRKEPGLDVEILDGNRGELTVSIEGEVIAQKRDNMPSVEEVVAAVRKAEPAAATTG